jgi:methyl-accepting chemotaxis protein
MIGSLAELVDNVLPKTVDSLQKSFNVAQDSARVIDGVLRGVTSIPFFPGEPYDPEVPLHESLADVSKSMDDLPQTFENMHKSLESTGGNLLTFNSQLSQLTESVSEINRSLTETKLVLDQYQEIVTGTLENIDKLRKNLPTLVNAAAAFITFILIWLAVAQFGVLMQGVAMVKSPPAAAAVEPLPLVTSVDLPEQNAE